jgi:quercetin dioxygenase-like cupin family protein
MSDEVFDLSTTFLHLGLGSTVTRVPYEGWSEEFVARLEAVGGPDGDEGRLVCVFEQPATWTTWERHPAGEEVVVLLSGRVDLIQELESGELRTIELAAGQAAINPRGVWHTVDVHEPGEGLFITPGRGTEHRPR